MERSSSSGPSPNSRRHARPYILVVEDDPLVRTNLRRMLEAKGADYSQCYSIVLVSNGLSAFGACVDRGAPLLAIVDYKLRVGASGRHESVDGLRLIAQIREHYPGSKIILYSGFADAALVMRAFGAGVNLVVHKGEDEPNNIQTAVRSLIGPPLPPSPP